MKNKVLLSLFSCFFFLMGCSSDNTPNTGTENSSLYEEGLEVVTLLDEMIHNDTYGQLMTSTPEIESIITPLKEKNYTDSPKEVYQITFSQDTVYGLLGLATSENNEMESASDSLKRDLNQKILASLTTQPNALQGANYLAASSIYTATKVFVNPQLQEDTLFIYLYEDSYPVFVTFSQGEDQAVLATGRFIFDNDFDLSTAFLSEELANKMTVTKIL